MVILKESLIYDSNLLKRTRNYFIKESEDNYQEINRKMKIKRNRSEEERERRMEDREEETRFSSHPFMLSISYSFYLNTHISSNLI